MPDYAIATSIDYETALSPHADAFFHGDFQYTGPSRGSFIVTDTNYRDPGYGVLNINFGTTISGTSIALYVKNVTDNKTIIQRPTTNTVVEGYTVRPRTIGVTVSRKF